MMHRSHFFLVFFLALSNLQKTESTKDVLKKFIQVSSTTLNAHKEIWGDKDVSDEQCAEECLRRPICASFEIHDNKCYLCEEDSSGVATMKKDISRNYFQRIRPNQEIVVLKRVTIPSQDHLGLMKNSDLSKCIAKCRENPLCKSFEFKESAKKCDLSNVTHLTHDLHPSKWGWDIYIFNPDYRPIDCGSPPEMDHGSVKYGATGYLANAEYTCETGELYTVVCQENNKWSKPDKICKKPLDCGVPPLLGYAGVDYKETGYKSKATYSCLMGEMYDVECTVEGKWTSPSGRCRGPRSCSEFKSCGKNVPDGEYWIYPKILEGQRVKVFCVGMSTNQPKEYITLKNENHALSSPLKPLGIFCLTRTDSDRSRRGKSIYSKVRLLPEKMELDITDHQYVSLINGYGSFKHDFAIAEDCSFRADENCDSTGTFEVNLIGTGLSLNKSAKWKNYGDYSRVQFIARSNNDQKIVGVCGGKCGGCRPDGPLKVNVFDDDLPNTISAEFCPEM